MDDKFHRNRKIRELRKRGKAGNEALGVWTFWWSWCLDDPDLNGEVPRSELSKRDEIAAELLVDVGLWDKTDDGFIFHDFQEYNPTREQIDSKRRADRERLSAKRKAKSTDVACDISASRERIAIDSQESPTRVASTRDPVPTQPNPGEESARLRAVPDPPPDLPDEASMRTPELVRRGFELRFMQALAIPPSWSHKAREHARVIAAWLDGFPDTETQLRKLLDNFFADPWATDKRFPIAALANDPQRYLAGIAQPSPPPGRGPHKVNYGRKEDRI